MFTKSRAVTLISLLLLSTLVHSAVPVIKAQQQPQRERRVATPDRTANPSLTPTPTPSPVPTLSPSASSAEVPQASPQATPAAAVVAPKPATTTRSLPELQTRISDVLAKPALAPAMVGIKVSSLETGKVLFEENADKLLRPASNMKLYTVAAALDRLSPDYRFVTSVYAPDKPDAAGTVHGDLTIYGRGDPSIAARFNNGNYFKGIDDLAARIVAAGVKRVEGDLIGDETYFIGPPYGAGWDWDDLQWWYGAEVSALTSNDNALDLSVKPGATVGARAVITTGPPDPLLMIFNGVTTVARGTKRDLTVYRGLNSEELWVNGSIALDDKGYSGSVGISRPALLFVYLLRSSLAQRGVIISGYTRRLEASPTGKISLNPAESYSLTYLNNFPEAPPVEIVQMKSPPLSLIAAQTLKPSQNLYTELILRTLGKVVAPATTAVNTARTSDAAGIEVVKAFLREAGVSPPTLVLTDGSGLSRNDMVTAEATLQLLTYMHRHRYASVFREALPIAGVDGTLRNRFKGTPAENNLRAKTGSLSSAASLSGYVTTAAGENLVFSIMVNNFPEDVEPRVVCIDPIAVLLASFAGKSDR
jgi:D-alanyl-D-alanine carboxypeptidase/D-alanyl-D-alanine-endopeptidase (penicillin-binding protein 4)